MSAPGAPAVRNKQLELTAAWLNTLAGAFVTAGAIAPLAASFFGFTGSTGPFATLTLAGGVLIFLSVGAAIHLVARIVSRGLKP